MTRTSPIKNCTVLVAGGAGFIGSHVVEHLVRDRHCHVIVLDDASTGHYSFISELDNVEIWRQDITKLCVNALKDWLMDHNVAWMFNYVAMPYVPISYHHPLRVVETNMTAAMTLLEASHRAGVLGSLQVSSAEVYGGATGKITESAPVRAHSTYGASKLAVDAYVQTRYREVQMRAIALRQFNCVGPRETHPYVIPEIISQVHRHGVIRLGNNSRRDFMYVKDAAHSAVRLLESGKFGEVYNLGSSHSIAIYDLAALIAREMNTPDVEIISDDSRRRAWEIWHLQSDNRKIEEAIGPVNETPLTTALQHTIAYFEQREHKWDWE